MKKFVAISHSAIAERVSVLGSTRYLLGCMLSGAILCSPAALAQFGSLPAADAPAAPSAPTVPTAPAAPAAPSAPSLPNAPATPSAPAVPAAPAAPAAPGAPSLPNAPATPSTPAVPAAPTAPAAPSAPSTPSAPSVSADQAVPVDSLNSMPSELMLSAPPGVAMPEPLSASESLDLSGPGISDLPAEMSLAPGDGLTPDAAIQDISASLPSVDEPLAAPDLSAAEPPMPDAGKYNSLDGVSENLMDLSPYPGLAMPLNMPLNDNPVEFDINATNELGLTKGRTFIYQPGMSVQFQLDEARLNLSAEALPEVTEISMQSLSQIDVPAMPATMLNVTGKTTRGFRIAPQISQFEEVGTVELPYDATALVAGVSEQNVRAYAFNSATNQWDMLELISIDTDAKRVVSRASRFNDMVTAVVVDPATVPSQQTATPVP